MVFDPTVGRWMEEDPISFASGTFNLSGAMGNDPTNATDPSGLEMVVKTQDNRKYRIGGAATGAEGIKADAQKTYGTPKVDVLPTRDVKKTTGTLRGEGSCFQNIPAGHLVGTTGAGPCIGLIIVGPADGGGNRDIRVYHFQAGDDPGSTLIRDVRGTSGIKKGSHAVIFGGDNQSRESMGTLGYLLEYLETTLKGYITIDGVYNSPGLWVDRDGNYYVHQAERRTAAADGTQPEPVKE